MNQCKDCRFYKMTYDGPYCNKNPRPVPVSPINSKDCFEEPAPTAEELGKSVVKEIVKQISDNIEKPKRKGGRIREHQNYVDENGVTMKWCRMCKQYKPIDEFYKKSGTPDGHAYECKTCRTAHQRKKREEKRVNTRASKRTRQRLEKSLEPLKDAITRPSELDRYVENVLFQIPMDLFSGKVEIVFKPGNDSVNVEIRRK